MTPVVAVLTGTGTADQTNTASDAAVQATGGSTMVISTSTPQPGGTRQLTSQGVAASGICYIRDQPASTTALAFAFWVKIVTTPSGNIQIRRLRNSSSGQFDLTVIGATGGSSANRIRMVTASTGGIVWTSAAALTVGTWYFLNGFVTQSSTSGTARLAYYTFSGGFTLVEDSGSLTGLDTGGSAYDNIITGAKPVTTTVTSEYQIGDWRQYERAASGMLALPTISGPPTADAGPDQSVTISTTVTLNGTGSITPTGTLTYAWTQTAGTTVTLSSSTAASPTFTAPGTGGTLTFSLVVNNGSFSSSPDTMNVVVSTSSIVTYTLSGNNGDPATAANTASSVTPLVTGASITIRTTSPSPGDTRRADFNGSTASGLGYIKNDFASTTGLAFGLWARLVSLPSGNLQFERLRNGNAGQVDLTVLLGTGRIRVADAGGSPIWTTTAAWTLGTWYYVNCYFTQNSVTGTARFQYYTAAGGTFTLVEDSGTQTGNTGTLPYDNQVIGAKPVTSPVAMQFDLGGTRRIDRAASGLMALPTIAATPDATAGADQTVEPFSTVILSAVGSVGTGVLSYAWALTSNTSASIPLLSDYNTISPSYKAPADWHTGSVQVWTVTVTGSGGSATADVTITTRPATVGVYAGGTSVTALRMSVA